MRQGLQSGPETLDVDRGRRTDEQQQRRGGREFAVDAVVADEQVLGLRAGDAGAAGVDDDLEWVGRDRIGSAEDVAGGIAEPFVGPDPRPQLIGRGQSRADRLGAGGEMSPGLIEGGQQQGARRRRLVGLHDPIDQRLDVSGPPTVPEVDHR